ncbi:MAG: hypothetical protein FH748_03510 [Balneolaceae bacterium]|nr:hypothetical protein [Balneolaceae bacterium]
MSEFKRQHPVAAISRLLAVIRQNFVTLLILLFIGGTGSGGEYFWYALIIGLVTAFFAGIFGWFRFTYRVIDGELQIKKGILRRSNLYLSRERIQVIDITEGLLQRMFGLVKVEVKTAGSGTESATISAITREEAEQLRLELRKRRSVETEDNKEKEQEEREIEYESWNISKKDLVYAAITSGNFGLIASILGAISGQMDQFVNEENLNYLYSKLPGFNNISLVIAVILFIIVVSWLLSFLGVIFKYSDFKVEKHEKELLVSSGLIERKRITIPFDRIQAVRYVEGVLRQPFGYGMLYVESAGFEQNSKERSIVLVPYLAAEELTGFLNQFLDEFDEPEYDTFPPQKSFMRYIRRPNYLLFLVLLPGAWLFWSYGWTLIFLTPLTVALGWLRYKDAALGIGESLLRMRYRVLARTTALVRKKRIQHIESSCNPFQRRKNIEHLKVMAASGSDGIAFTINDLRSEDCDKTYKWLIGTHENSESEQTALPGNPEAAGR